jgi:hypothetical protein
MYLNATVQKYLSEYLGVPPKDIYKFDNSNGTSGYRVTNLQSLTRVQISKIEKETDLFLREVVLDHDLTFGYLSAEFIKI